MQVLADPHPKVQAAANEALKEVRGWGAQLNGRLTHQ